MNEFPTDSDGVPRAARVGVDGHAARATGGRTQRDAHDSTVRYTALAAVHSLTRFGVCFTFDSDFVLP